MKWMRRVLINAALAFAMLAGAGSLWARKEAVMPANFGSPEWAAANWSQAVDYLRYVTSGKNRDNLLKAPEDQRVEAWDKFWLGYDTTGVAKTEDAVKYRDRFFERVRYANENFGTLLQYGWETERGEAWIRLGPPRWTERYPMRAGGKNLIVWEYFEPYEIDLVFMDRSGLGDYYLLNPTSMIDRAYLYGD